MACAWHRLAQNLDLRGAQRSAKRAFAVHSRQAA
jgi:hypothetical protein